MRVCARVLAAALMTGAIAGAFALPSLVGQGVEEPRALPAPPSVKLRTLHLPVLKAPVEHTIVVRRHVAHRAARPAALIAVRIAARVKHAQHRTVVQATASAGRSGLPSRSPTPSPAAPTPKPTPAAPAPPPVSPAPSAPPERALASTAQPATPAPPVAPPAKSGDDDHGNGHAYGRSKQGDDDGQGEDKGNGQGDGKNGKGNGHKK